MTTIPVGILKMEGRDLAAEARDMNRDSLKIFIPVIFNRSTTTWAGASCCEAMVSEHMPLSVREANPHREAVKPMSSSFCEKARVRIRWDECRYRKPSCDLQIIIARSTLA